MKWLTSTPLFFPFALIISCNDFKGPISGDFDPLGQPGATTQTDSVASNYTFKSGSYVTAATNSTAFFSKRPQGNAVAEDLLAAGTSMRVVKSEGSFVKVELEDGKVGYVASALLSQAGVTDSNAVQVYPPVGGESALPLLGNPGELPSAVSPLPPTDASTGAPVPPIDPPTIPDLPPPSTINPPATDELPPSSADMKEKKKEVEEEVEKSVELPEPQGSSTPPPPPVDRPRPE